MTVDALKSEAITNAIATPRVLTDAHLAGGILRESVGSITAPTAAAEATSKYFFCRVPSNARISQVLWSSPDFTTAGAVNVGIWQTPENGGAVVDADLFAAALALQSGPYQNLDITYQSTEYTVAESEKMLWEVLGLTTDPKRDYDVVAQVSTAFDGGKPMCLKVRYVV